MFDVPESVILLPAVRATIGTIALMIGFADVPVKDTLEPALIVSTPTSSWSGATMYALLYELDIILY